MWQEAFMARLARKRELVDQGHVELEDQLGSRRDLGPVVRTGLLRHVEPCCPLQRYHGHVPSSKGARFLDYCAEHHLIMVRAGLVEAFEEEIAHDGSNEAGFIPPHAPLPFGLASAPPAVPDRREEPDPLAALAKLREEERRWWLREGYADLEALRTAIPISDRQLLASGLFRPRDEGMDKHALPFVPVGKGEQFMTLVVPWDLLLIKPEMARSLFLLIDRGSARQWMDLLVENSLPAWEA